MSVNVPDTIWRRTSGNGELATDSGFLTTLSGNQITTLSGNDLIILGGSYTPVPASVWAKVGTTPASEWRPPDGLSEFSSEGASDIVDSSADNLVDPSGDQIVDTGVIETDIPASVWEEDDSL